MRYLILSFAVAFTPIAAAAPVEFKPSDRVVLIGGTVVEREQRHGYWEAALTAHVPGVTGNVTCAPPSTRVSSHCPAETSR